ARAWPGATAGSTVGVAVFFTTLLISRNGPGGIGGIYRSTTYGSQPGRLADDKFTQTGHAIRRAPRPARLPDPVGVPLSDPPLPGVQRGCGAGGGADVAAAPGAAGDQGVRWGGGAHHRGPGAPAMHPAPQ